METFTSSNGIKMIGSELYNWRVVPVYQDKPEPVNYTISIGTWGLMYTAFYDPAKEILSISNMALDSERSEDVLKFYCATLWDAEVIVAAFVKASPFHLNGTIYDKKSEKP